MCGRLRLDQHPLVHRMLEELRAQGELIFAPDRAPGDQVSIVFEKDGERRVEPATWWLLLDPATMKPVHKYASFNSRYDKLNVPRSAAYVPYRKSRCIVPATAIIEGIGEGKNRVNHIIEELDGIMVCGGLYKTWLNRETGELTHSCSVITLPPVPGWENIHDKAMPLLLPQDNIGLLERWLDPTLDKVEEFEYLLQPIIRAPQRATRIGKVSKWDPVADPFIIPAQVAG